MYKENTTIIAKRDISELIRKNTIGVILSVYDGGRFYLIEFIDANGQTLGTGMETISSDDIELFNGFSENSCCFIYE